MTESPIGLTIWPMRLEHARAIVDWHYPGFYSFYDLRHYPEDVEEILDEGRWGKSIFSVLDNEGVLVGELVFQTSGRELEIGIALRPDLVGKGLGKVVLRAGMDFALDKFDFDIFTIRVWKLNQRAIRVYENAGFRADGEFMNTIQGIGFRFIRMIREGSP